MIVVWGRSDDTPAIRVAGLLEAQGAPVLFLDHDRLGSDLDVEVVGERPLTLRLSQRETTSLVHVTALYLRCSPRSSDSPSADRFYRRLMAAADVCDALVVNRPSAMAANNSKPWQGLQLEESGLRCPPTLVTNDRAQVVAFARDHGRLIYKSTSGTRSIVHEFDPADLQRLAALGACPVTFQPLLQGVNHRVHVMGDTTFVAAIESSSLDYRYAGADGGTTSMRPARIPAEVTDACLRAAGSAGLLVAGLDLIHTLDDDWVCFEMNPSPAFTWFEDLTGAPLSACVADLLARGDRAISSTIHEREVVS